MNERVHVQIHQQAGCSAEPRQILSVLARWHLAFELSHCFRESPDVNAVLLLEFVRKMVEQDEIQLLRSQILIPGHILDLELAAWPVLTHTQATLHPLAHSPLGNFAVQRGVLQSWGTFMAACQVTQHESPAGLLQYPHPGVLLQPGASSAQF